MDRLTNKALFALPSAALALVLLLSGCGSLMHHQVQKGETLYSISWRYSKDVNQLAAWNSLKIPYVIHQGQMLRISPPLDKSSPALLQSAGSQSPGKSSTVSRTTSVIVPTKANNGANTRPVIWGWPAQGKLISTFAAKKLDRKGIDISGASGSPIRAAASGRVVYSGSGLARYGNLLIIKHNDSYLSAYAHNKKLLAKEGESVKKGQKVARMGATGSDQVMLHFEIRRNGKPVDPQRYLPKW